MYQQRNVLEYCWEVCDFLFTFLKNFLYDFKIGDYNSDFQIKNYFSVFKEFESLTEGLNLEE